MRITYPHMGHLSIVIRALLTGLGLDVVLPPPTSRRTVELGVRHSPEFACFPFKLNMGNYLEAKEMGADTILMAGGVGPCRFGYYAQVQQQILSDLGIEMEMVVLEPPDVSFREVKDKIRYLIGDLSWWQMIKAVRFAWCKARAVDTIEEKLLHLRPRVTEPQKLESYFREALQEIDGADNRKKVQQVVRGFLIRAETMPQHSREPLRVGLVGEIFTVLEPFANYDIEKRLGLLGVEVTRSIWLSAWINEHLLGGLLRIRHECVHDKQLAAPYLNSFVGGHGKETVGCTVGFAQRNYDGVIQLAPLTCMPEIVAHSVFPAISKDYDMPLLTFYLDELSGEAGIQTRLEAFIDLIAAYSRNKEGVL
jgi:predicted nucleotide-binding protein (sugar kinase/HSP70/actin superfamily)